ncbi:MAG: hypothetical protein ABR947_05655 [Solirubrobacteraceae bacterium]|jgi:hypothetical protein
MIYSVVPRELEPQLLGPLTAHYADQPDVVVIVDRRKGERRSRRGDTPADAAAHQRELRDRRRRRVGGDFAPLRGEGSLNSAA